MIRALRKVRGPPAAPSARGRRPRAGRALAVCPHVKLPPSSPPPRSPAAAQAAVSVGLKKDDDQDVVDKKRMQELKGEAAARARVEAALAAARAPPPPNAPPRIRLHAPAPRIRPPAEHNELVKRSMTTFLKSQQG